MYIVTNGDGYVYHWPRDRGDYSSEEHVCNTIEDVALLIQRLAEDEGEDPLKFLGAKGCYIYNLSELRATEARVYQRLKPDL